MLQVIGLTVLVLVYGNVIAVTEHTEVINRSQWPEYENGTNVIALPQVKEILQRFEEHEKVNIEIRYPGGDFGQQWSQSLGRWLVTFGVPQKYLEFFPGTGSADLLTVSIIDRR